MKKIISILIAITMVFGIVMPVYAVGLTQKERIQKAAPLADKLKELGLFYGTDKGYELEKEPTRAEGLAMLIRLLGEEDNSQNSNNKHPFKDVPAWADKYVGFAYVNKLTSGVSSAEFGSQNKITAVQYITFVLRALGYQDGTDFTWDKSYVLAEKIGLIDSGEYRTANDFLRADVVIISYNALDIKFKGLNETLRERLFGKGTPTPPTEWWQAGMFIIPAEKRIVVDKAASLNDNINRLNGVLGKHCNLRFFSRGIAMNNDEPADTAIITQHSDGRFGIKISNWRTSYDSSVGSNEKLNMVLDAMYFLTGDEQVAKALWNWIDTANINHGANSDDFGFVDVGYNGNNLIIKMNNTKIEVEKGSNYRTYWFFN